MTTEIIEQEVVELEELMPYEDNDDPLHRTHIIDGRQNDHITQGAEMSGQDVVDTARLLGMEVVALCGYKWVPKHNPQKFDVCQACIHVINSMG